MIDAKGEVQAIVAVFTAVTAHATMRESAERLAMEDELTGLPNRRRFLRELHRHLEYVHRYARPGAVLLIDLDRFKEINDRHGHLAGDEVLRGVGRRLSARLRSTDFLARLQGDEFAVLLPEATQENAADVADSLRASLACGPVEAGDDLIRLSASIGLAGTDPDTSIEDVLAAADHSLYAAKRRTVRASAIAAASEAGTTFGGAG